jgi:STE24 endopeptidase
VPFVFRRIVTCFLMILLFLAAPRFAAAQSAAPPAPAAPTAQAQPPQPRSEQAYSLPPDKLAKAKILNRIRLSLDIAGTFWGLAVLWWLLASRTASRLERWTGRCGSLGWVQGLLFFAGFIVITSVAGLPLDMIGHIASRHYGISIQGWGSWFGDEGKALALALALGTWVLLLFNWIVRRWPRRYWLVAWAVAVPLMILAAVATPFFEPLFDKYEPLQKNHPRLAAKLEEVARRTGTDIPPSRMYLMKASLKSNGLNAYVSGFGPTKRLVMWDTVTDRMPDDEAMFIFGHESGHYVLHHIAKGLALSAAACFFIFWACAWAAAWMTRRFGARWGVEAHPDRPPLATRTGFLSLILVVSIAGFLLEPASNTVSRYFEHQADVYGQEAIHGLVPHPRKTAVSAFNHLGEAWLEDPNPNRFIEFWLYSHPSVQQRAEFAEHYDPWANGGHGRYFKN